MCWPRPPGPRSAVEENLASPCISWPAEEPAEDTPRSLLLPAAVDLEVLMWHRAWNWAGSCAGGEQHGQSSARHLGYGQPARGADARIVRIWPVRDPSAICSAPFHSVATMKSVFPSAPPSIQAKQPRSSSTVWSTTPPSRTRTQCLLPTSAYQRAPSASRQIPSG